MSEYILQTRNLTKTYKSYNAVNNVSISLEPGKIYGLIGRNGVGKRKHETPQNHKRNPK